MSGSAGLLIAQSSEEIQPGPVRLTLTHVGTGFKPAPTPTHTVPRTRKPSDLPLLLAGVQPGLRLVIHKERQILEVQESGRILRTFRVCLGLDPVGSKKGAGDKKTPEGDYFICLKQTESRFHRFMGISYPGEEDAQRAFDQGLIALDTRDAIIREVRQGNAPPWNTALGGWVGIHGYPTDENHRRWAVILFPKPHNWTDGCIALWNHEIDELFSVVPVGTPVSIRP
jgi:murein L,D-transpeptidase YafK